MHSTKIALTFCTCLLLPLTVGCLDPLASDEVGPSGAILVAGASVPSAHDDLSIEQSLRENDGVDSLIPLLKGFAGGQSTRYWDFGASNDYAIPLYAVMKRDADNALVPTGHPNIIDSIPGEEGYSPFWKVFILEVSDKYDDEIFPSFAAVDEAIRTGLVVEPTDPGLIVNCPVTARDVRMELGGGSAAIAPPSTFFWQGQSVNYFDLGIVSNASEGRAMIADMYELKREGREILSEPVRGVDISGDGDVVDTNNIFSSLIGNMNYTSLVRRTRVTIPFDSTSIDTIPSDNNAQFNSSEQLFDPEANPDAVIAFEVGTVLLNLPQQATLGEL